MKRLALICLVAISGCTQKVTSGISDVNASAKTVTSSYLVHPYFEAEVDIAHALTDATRSCQLMGMKKASKLGKSTKVCAHPTQSDCVQYRVSTVYQCYN